MVGVSDIAYVTKKEAERKDESEIVLVPASQIQELEKEGYHVITDSEHFAGGEV